ncbi:hypothetical protein GWI33_019884 [Rhynchophorus ferrugineus]|uniref:Uncharacterized protein n=1 Tax=Rhynchophorus ferrugineus TaxID=354439 RepID=A0A834M026_RHYFE|nr:hypothetical protein GWI33_019884 [Rhynchophorus ferrugineus]
MVYQANFGHYGLVEEFWVSRHCRSTTGKQRVIGVYEVTVRLQATRRTSGARARRNISSTWVTEGFQLIRLQDRLRVLRLPSGGLWEEDFRYQSQPEGFQGSKNKLLASR